MPIVRTTPATIPDRTHCWITGFHVTGLEPGGSIRIEIPYAGCHLVDEAYIVDETFACILTGQDAIDFVVEHLSVYAEIKDVLYQKLIDNGLEEGEIT